MQVELELLGKYPMKKDAANTDRLQRLLIIFSLINLLIVSLLGLLLRSYPFLNTVGLSYKNVLHGHSHFAFGGWIMPAILALLLRCFPQIEKAVAYHHWRNISILLLTSAYGMLVAFPLQGYKVISICFSTLSISAGYYLAIVSWKAMRQLPLSLPLRFLKWGLFYFVLSSLGPFATGPLIAMGKTGSPLYFDAIYFYLHFQYNGWFVFALMVFLYQYLEKACMKNNGARIFRLLNYACVPTYFLSVLWHQHFLLFNIVGGIGAVLQLYAAWLMVTDVMKCRWESKWIKQILNFVLAAFAVKVILQVLSPLPSIALMAYQYRNFVIAYLHLVLLGCISSFLIVWIIRNFKVQPAKQLRIGLIVFIVAFIASETVIIAQPLVTMAGYAWKSYSLILFLVSIFLPIGIGLFGRQIINDLSSSSWYISKTHSKIVATS